MFRYLIVALCLPFYLLAPLQSAAQLPDFTELVEKQGPRGGQHQYHPDGVP